VTGEFHLLEDEDTERSGRVMQPMLQMEKIDNLVFDGKLHALGEALAERAVTPVYATCRAFGGGTGKLSVVDLESTLRELFSLW
jgi:hypothetical protein